MTLPLLQILLCMPFLLIATTQPLLAQSKTNAPWQETGLQGSSQSNQSEEIRQLFIKKEFRQVIKNAKQHLRKNSKDTDTWLLLAASYFHVGEFKKSNKILFSLYGKAKDKTYLNLYIGLNYKYLNQEKKSEKYLKLAGRGKTVFSSYALYDLALLKLSQNEKSKTIEVLQEYKLRFPKGQQWEQVRTLLQALQKSTDTTPFLESGLMPIDQGSALYREHSYSAMQYPHFWRAMLGTKRTSYQSKYPVIGGALSDLTVSQQSLHAEMGFGIGPINDGLSEIITGYEYQMIWHTTEERLKAYGEDYADLEYFPFRPDLMERRHVLYADMKRQLPWQNSIGLYGRLEFARIGSKIFPGPDDTQINRSLPTRDVTLLMPYWTYAFDKRLSLTAYLYFLKVLNADETDYSQKTYDFADPILSFGGKVDYFYPNLSLNTNLTLYQYEFIFNDYWLDYKERGLNWQNRGELIYNFSWLFNLEWMQRDYILPRQKVGGCTSDVNAIIAGAIPKPCARKTKGIAWEAGLGWSYQPQISVDFTFAHRAHTDASSQKEYDWSYNELLLSVSMAFPSVEKASRYSHYMMPTDETLFFD